MLKDLDPKVDNFLNSYTAPSGINSMTMFEHASRLFWITTYGSGIGVHSLDTVSVKLNVSATTI